MKKTTPNVFIIESLSFEDEKSNLYEGEILSQILHLGGKESEYIYLRTKKELQEALKQFNDSGYRYLHLSCHGTNNTIETTLDSIRFLPFKELVKPYLKKRRLFLSACEATNAKLASIVIPSSKCQSIVGPRDDIYFNEAPIIWAAFYHLVFKAEPERMRWLAISSSLRKVSTAFGVHLNYFWASRKEGVKHREIRPRQRYVKRHPSK
jgi:hypothetical protein